MIGAFGTGEAFLIDTATFASYELWDAAGQPIIDVLPARYGAPAPRRFANVNSPAGNLRPLDTTAGERVEQAAVEPRGPFAVARFAGRDAADGEVLTG